MLDNQSSVQWFNSARQAISSKKIHHVILVNCEEYVQLVQNNFSRGGMELYFAQYTYTKLSIEGYFIPVALCWSSLFENYSRLGQLSAEMRRSSHPNPRLNPRSNPKQQNAADLRRSFDNSFLTHQKATLCLATQSNWFVFLISLLPS